MLIWGVANLPSSEASYRGSPLHSPPSQSAWIAKRAKGCYLLLHNVFNFQFHTNKYWSEFHQKLLDLFIHWQWSIFAWAAHLTGPTSCFNTSQPVANSSKNYVAGHCDLSPTLQAKQQSNGDTLDTGRELFKIFSYKILFAKEQKHNWIEKLQGDDGCSNQNYVLVIQTQEA